jgi:DNA-binding Lrp family transcriptional regulator
VTDDTRTRALRLVEADPTLSAAQIAAALGVSRQWVHRILRDAGYVQGWQKEED